MGLPRSRLLVLSMSFPWGPWAVFVSLAVYSSIISHLAWHRRGRRYWYSRGLQGAFANQFTARLLPVALLFSCLSIAIVFRFVFYRLPHDVWRTLSDGIAWALIGLGGISGLLVLSVFLVGVPQFLIAPAFRKQDKSEDTRHPDEM